MENHSPNIFGAIGLAGNEGLVNQVLSSAGPGLQAIWQNATSLARLYAATDKVSQIFALAAADVTWNIPAADAITGITFNAGNNQFTLLANRTYLIFVTLKPSAAALAWSAAIVDTANTPVGSLNQPISGLASLEHTHAIAFFRPLVNTAIKVRMTSAVAITISQFSSILIFAMD